MRPLSRETSFLAGAPGTYYYWAHTLTPEKYEPFLQDAQLNGAFIVDPPGAAPADRVFVINLMSTRAESYFREGARSHFHPKSQRYKEPRRELRYCEALFSLAASERTLGQS
jgi:hypothetical protein